MKSDKRDRLSRRGWTVGSTAEFLKLTPQEELLVEVKAALTSAIRERRRRMGLTQSQLAARMHSSQSRIAKLEAGEGSVSTDLMLSALAGLGLVEASELANVFSSCRFRQHHGQVVLRYPELDWNIPHEAFDVWAHVDPGRALHSTPAYEATETV
jgi:transcriptional regulator with XRE-family HTH domain